MLYTAQTQMGSQHEMRDGVEAPLTLLEFTTIVREALNQSPWRAQADMEADYADGNQLSTELMARMRRIGIPPAKENIIGPAIAAVCGYEAKTRTDWRVTPDGDPNGQDVADVLNYKLNQAERHSRADRALSQAFRAMASVGIGWVEVAKAATSMEFPIKCRYVHRGEIWWDMKGDEPDLSDARWLFRRRWVPRTRAAIMFPKDADIIKRCATQWIAGYSDMLDGGHSTGLAAAYETERGWTLHEDQWYNDANEQVCITEIWYRRWMRVTMLKLRSGRAVQFDQANPAHSVALAQGAKLIEEVVPKVRRAYWMGPHMLYDGPSPYAHNHFPYVRVMGYQEDLTGIPYGLVRDMLFPQDNLNSTLSKLRWGISSTRTRRTKGATEMTDEQVRRQAARPDADFILNPEAMAAGGIFEIERDFQLNAQQFQMMDDARRAVDRMGVTPAFKGQTGTSTSGIQEQTQVEQSEISLADLMDNFKEARTQVGEMIMSILIQDMGREEQTVVVEGDAINEAREVVLNHPEIDPITGLHYMSNDIQRTRLMVALEDVPSTSGFRAQQLSVLSEAVKSAPEAVQPALLPFLIDLMDLPRKKQVVEAIRQAQAGANADPEAIRKQVERDLMYDLKQREIALKEKMGDAQLEKIIKDTVLVGVQSAFSAMQAAAQVAQMPMIAPIADAVMQSQGAKDPNFQAPPPGQQVEVQMKEPFLLGQGTDDQALAEQQAAELNAAADTPQNTSPNFPARPAEPATGMTGMETATVADNIV